MEGIVQMAKDWSSFSLDNLTVIWSYVSPNSGEEQETQAPLLARSMLEPLEFQEQDHFQRRNIRREWGDACHQEYLVAMTIVQESNQTWSLLFILEHQSIAVSVASTYGYFLCLY